MIAVIDYGMGNLGNVQRALKVCGAKSTLCTTPASLKRAQKIILPGVGAFPDAVKELKRIKLWDALKDEAAEGKPLLGVCLGYQLLFTSSHEGGKKIKGLDLIPGDVTRFPKTEYRKKRLKVPHMGWNKLKQSKKSRLLKGVKDDDYFYFVHSFFPKPKRSKDILGKTPYGKLFASAVERKNIFGFQFHPEKSQDAGLRILKNFIALN